MRFQQALVFFLACLTVDTKVYAGGDPLPPRAVARIGRVLSLRHAGSVGAVAFAPDGKVLASGGDDNAVRLWDVRSGKQLRCLRGHEKGVHQLAFAPNGKMLASGDGSGIVRLWDTASGRELDRLHLDPDDWHPLVALTFSVDGTRLAAASEVGLIWWETATGRQLGECDPSSNAVRAIAFAADGKSLALFCRDKFVICDAANGKVRRESKAVEGFSASFSRDGKLLATGAEGGQLHLWDGRTGKPLFRLPRGGAGDGRLVLSADGFLAASTDSNPSHRLCLTRLDTRARH